MIGDGTQGNPYQITTVAELRQYIAMQGVYLKLMNDIDFNNDTVLWGWKPLYAACTELDGNGKKITNCYCYQKSFIVLSCTNNNTSVTIKNTIIEAIYFTGINQSTIEENYGFIQSYNYSIGNSQVSIYFYDCDFRVKLYVEADNKNFIYSRIGANEGLVYLRRCIFNLDVYPNSHSKLDLFYRQNINNNTRYAEVNSCEIKINLHLANSLFTGKTVFYTDTNNSSAQRYVLSISNPYSARSDCPNLNNCAVFINIDGINENLPDKLCIMLNEFKGMSNCYFILNDVKGNYLQTKSIIFENYDEGTSLTSCFINDKATFKTRNDKGLENDANMHMLSDAECKDLQTLLDIGFLVV